MSSCPSSRILHPVTSLSPAKCPPSRVISDCIPYPPGSAAKSCTGLLEWPDQDTALDAFVLANHQTIYSQSTSDHHTAPGDPPSSSLLVTTVVYLPVLLSVPPLHHHYVIPPFCCALKCSAVKVK